MSSKYDRLICHFHFFIPFFLPLCFFFPFQFPFLGPPPATLMGYSQQPFLFFLSLFFFFLLLQIYKFYIQIRSTDSTILPFTHRSNPNTINPSFTLEFRYFSVIYFVQSFDFTIPTKQHNNHVGVKELAEEAHERAKDFERSQGVWRQ